MPPWESPATCKSACEMRRRRHLNNSSNSRLFWVVASIAFATALGLAAQSQPRTDAFVESKDHPAVAYTSGATHNAVSDLNEQLRRGTLKLSFDPANGYLRS